jgi:AcrR family transcriptional regulator
MFIHVSPHGKRGEMAREPKESVREKILTAAEERFWQFGIKKTTIDEIAVDAEVGKGTVYLHFDSKEEIAVEIITRYKRGTLDQQRAVAADKSLPLLERIKRVLSLPVCLSHEHCRKSPMVMELLASLRPHLGDRLRSLFDTEVDIVRELLDEANAAGIAHVEDTRRAAFLLKSATMCYMPLSTLCSLVDNPSAEIADLVDLIYNGLK